MTNKLLGNPLTATIIQFLREIGLEVRATQINEETFLPGIQIDHGIILFDEARLKYPGDLLHEAGHLAIKSKEERKQIHLDAGNDAAEEMMAIAWSYAASIYLQLPPEVVFHPNGYRGDSQALIENFTQGHYFAVPMLQWLGMTADKRQAEKLGIAPYPWMVQWLRVG
jgi:hypothetical protein